jgi:hypothetical protein
MIHRFGEVLLGRLGVGRVRGYPPKRTTSYCRSRPLEVDVALRRLILWARPCLAEVVWNLALVGGAEFRPLIVVLLKHRFQPSSQPLQPRFVGSAMRTTPLGRVTRTLCRWKLEWECERGE